MSRFPQVWASEEDHLRAARPEHPVFYFAPEVLARTARRFRNGFDGLVTFAVKANPERAVLENLVGAGIAGFDVASPAEIALIREIAPKAALHYNNPVRSRAEIAFAVEAGVASYSVDGMGELAKLIELVPMGVEVAVRLHLGIPGAAYDFGEKFGEGPAEAAVLLRAVKAAGFTPAMTFHPGTQCADPSAWARYIEACAAVSREAGVRLARLNVGGGFPANRGRHLPELEEIFDTIHLVRDEAFGAEAPALVCEPGRAMVADAFSLAVQVKAMRSCGALFLNDGIYGALSEAPLMGAVERLRVVAPDGGLRGGAPVARVLYGPTCDSVDRLPDPVALPGKIAEGDYILFDGMGAYSTVTATRFNGYGGYEIATVRGR
ncbi:type III PLP-dependent enzyme [Sinisalibacter aestuarii]|uniref:ornithine decarboxylase n=1 Tax=Sinisalibacter aestuarii TaxID=2949426 RepID=A0ABQ5LSV5_9RHOB|nr:type III PLP-dependent enzyme [Sinisalibacter aestuarii]GKY87172.1 ornithine decarboxylase [Sinisalibacter aestuarii]